MESQSKSEKKRASIRRDFPGNAHKLGMHKIVLMLYLTESGWIFTLFKLSAGHV
jgi:hypothetical protein